MMKREENIKRKTFCIVKKENLILDVYLSTLAEISSSDLSSLLSNVEMIHIRSALCRMCGAAAEKRIRHMVNNLDEKY